jgi:hypothetical protein
MISYEKERKNRPSAKQFNTMPEAGTTKHENTYQIPLTPPLLKGDFTILPFGKGGDGGDFHINQGDHIKHGDQGA